MKMTFGIEKPNPFQYWHCCSHCLIISEWLYCVIDSAGSIHIFHFICFCSPIWAQKGSFFSSDLPPSPSKHTLIHSSRAPTPISFPLIPSLTLSPSSPLPPSTGLTVGPNVGPLVMQKQAHMHIFILKNSLNVEQPPFRPMKRTLTHMHLMCTSHIHICT